VVLPGVAPNDAPTTVSAGLVEQTLDEIAGQLTHDQAFPDDTLRDARRIFEEVALGAEFITFLTLPAYALLP
jgi:malate synthase